MKSNLLDDLAIRLAATCKNLGLDDADEDLLWRYLMQLPSGQQLPGEIVLALKEQSEASPVAVLSYSWTATFPERFYKTTRSRLAKLGMGLKAGGVTEFNNRPLYVRSFVEYVFPALVHTDHQLPPRRRSQLGTTHRFRRADRAHGEKGRPD
jgi:hypothetical protein